MSRTVIISCAGMGRRLGIGTTKALIEIENKPLIIRHLEALKDVKDIRIVVGYHAEKLIKVVTDYRKDVTFVFNHDYMNNGTGASVCLALRNSSDKILTIDGDIIIHPKDYEDILATTDEFIGVTNPSTDNPVLVDLNSADQVTEFSRTHGTLEWTGIMQVKKERINTGVGHVYQLIENSLPIKAKKIRLKEIDTPNDFDKAKRWINNGYIDLPTIGVVGGMGSYATLDFFKRLLDGFPAQKEWERPRILIDNYCTIPSRVRGILYNENVDAIINELSHSIMNMINQGATFIVLACNTSHYYLPAIYEKLPGSESYILDILDLCCKEISTSQKKGDEVLLLASEGTILSNIYIPYFEKYGIQYKLPNQSTLEKIREYIEIVKQNKMSEENIKQFERFVNVQPNTSIILGCTELPVLYAQCSKINKKIFDPLQSVITYLKKII